MVEGPVSSRRFSRRQIRSILMIAGGAIAALVIVVGGWQFYSSSSESAAVETQRQLDEFAKQQAQQIAVPFAELDNQLAALAQDPAVIALFNAADKMNLASAAALSCFGAGAGASAFSSASTRPPKAFNIPLIFTISASARSSRS